MISLATKHDDPQKKLSVIERLGYGCGNLGQNIVNAICGAFALIYYTNVAGLNPAVVGSIIGASKIMDGGTDLLMGAIVDKTNSKHGKARAWLLRLCIPFALTAVLMFSVPSFFSEHMKYVYVFFTYNLVNSIFYTGLNVPYSSMNYLLTQDRFERGLLGNFNQIFSTLGNVLVNTFFMKLIVAFGNGEQYVQRAWSMTVGIFSIIVVIVLLFSFISTKERVKAADRQKDNVGPIEGIKCLFRNKYWIMIVAAMFLVFIMIGLTAVSGAFFVQYNIGDMNYYSSVSNALSVAQFGIMLITPFIMKKIGKHRTYQIGIALIIVGFALCGFFESSLAVVIATNIIKGCGFGIAGAMVFGMLSDTIDYGYWKSNVKCVGLANSASSFSLKVGLGFGISATGWILNGFGFDATVAEQTTEALAGINLCYNFIPLVLAVILFVLMLFYKLDEEFPTILKELEERNQ